MERTMTDQLQDAYKLADTEAVKICGLPRPNDPMAQAVQIFARAVVLIAADARRGLAVIDAARNAIGVSVDHETGVETVCFQPVEKGVATDLFNALVAFDQPQVVEKKTDLTAPLIESTVNHA